MTRRWFLWMLTGFLVGVRYYTERSAIEPEVFIRLYDESFPTEEHLQLIRRNFPNPTDVWPNLDKPQ